MDKVGDVLGTFETVVYAMDKVGDVISTSEKAKVGLVPILQSHKDRKLLALETTKLEGGDKKTMYVLARLYKMGKLGIAKGNKKAMELYAKASDGCESELICTKAGQGNKEAMFAWATLLESGQQGFPKDIPESMIW